MKRALAPLLAAALLFGASGPARAAGTLLTPMNPGFHQLLTCTPQGYVTIDVAAPDPKVDAHAMLVTTAIAFGPQLAKTIALRESDGRGDVYALGYILQPGVTKRFPRRLLLPAAPPAAGERSTYFNISGVVIDKRYDGPRPARDAGGRPATGYAFSDELNGRRTDTIVYVPGTGVTEARFYGAGGSGGDVVCHPKR